MKGRGAVVAASICQALSGGMVAQSVDLIPYPAELERGSGHFSLSSETSILLSPLDDEVLRSVVELWAAPVRAATGFPMSISPGPADEGSVGSIAFVLEIDGKGIGTAAAGPKSREAESYLLTVTPQAIRVSAPTAAGVFYATQTLRQLLPSDAEGTFAAYAAGAPEALQTTNGADGAASPSRWRIPALRVRDAPRFPYRGMHLDVGRHLFPVEFVKKYIDLLASYKMNTFHWHLTEDQGWRIEIKKYPRLTEVGAWRKETIVAKNVSPYVGDGRRYGGFYTQDEVREIVAYAEERHVTIIPEIEMPGHSLAALAAYPELACTDGPFEVGTRWGVFEDIYCPSERTFAFLEDVLTEVMELFPSPYVHIGGDEAPKARWERSELAQEVISAEGLADEKELQSWFIRRIENFLLSHGRRLIGWDEILEGGLAPEATVMSWRGMEGGIEAARQGHDVIMTPTAHAYFDYYQGAREQEPLAIGGFLPLERVYAFEPVPDELTAEEGRHVLGAQGNVWTEYMRTTDYVEYMVFPRLLAMAEVAWTPADVRDWPIFLRRLGGHLDRLEARGVNYRIPEPEGLERERLTFEETIAIELFSPSRNAVIRYTLNGDPPTDSSPVYTGSLTVPVHQEGTVVTARAFLADGRVSAWRTGRYMRTELRPPAGVRAEELRGGLRYDYFESRIRSVARLRNLSPRRSGIAAAIGFQGGEREDEFGLRFSFFNDTATTEIYTLRVTSDDGSQLYIDEDLVVDHDGRHTAYVQSGQVALAKGFHSLTLLYFESAGGQSLEVEIELPDGSRQALPGAWLFHSP
jgi:hexosaminidase